MNFIQDLLAGFVPLWNNLLLYVLHVAASYRWTQHDHSIGTISSVPTQGME